MKLEDQVCSLELAKRLKALGVKQESVFCWQKRPSFETDERGERIAIDKFGLYGPILPFDPRVTETFAAFTVAELGEMLPQNVWHYSYGSERLSEVSIAFPGKSLETHLPVRHTEAADTEADVRASMVCYLIEKGLLDAKKIG